MKKILLFALALTIGVMANSVETKNRKGSGVNFILDKEMIILYDNEETADTFNKLQRDALLGILKNDVCSSKDSRDLIENKKFTVKYIYLHKTDITVVRVSDCKGIELKKEKG